jgi:transposase
MAGKQTKYDEEFKRSVVALREGGKTLGELKRDYGVSESAVHEWCKKYAKVQVDSDGTVMTMKQIQELQKRLASLEKENQILKKAVAIFSPHSK